MYPETEAGTCCIRILLKSTAINGGITELAAEEQSIRRRLCFLKARLAQHGNDANLLLRERDYRDKLIGKMARVDNQGSHVIMADRAAIGTA